MKEVRDKTLQSQESWYRAHLMETCSCGHVRAWHAVANGDAQFDGECFFNKIIQGIIQGAPCGCERFEKKEE